MTDSKTKKTATTYYLIGVGILFAGLVESMIATSLSIDLAQNQEIWLRLVLQLAGLAVLAFAEAKLLSDRFKPIFVFIAGIAIGILILTPGYYRALGGPLAHDMRQPIDVLMNGQGG